jgi:anaerobic magnesium-protoporphyrin IX monomethyl ester cyclase
MRLLLVRPPARNTIETEVPKAVEAENTSYPPLALLALATWLRANSSHEVAILDAQLEDLEPAAITRRIQDYQADVVGITTFTVQLVDVQRTVQAARAAPCVHHVVLGGPHCNDFPAEARALPGISAVVRGEGQRPLLALLDAWQAGASPADIPGVMLDPAGPVPEHVVLSDDLDAYPIPDRSLVDYKRYTDLLGTGGLFTTVVTSRGCPHQCSFCNTPRLKFHSASPARICDELEACIALDIRDIYFVDDTFNVTNKRVHALCDEILARRIELSWTARMRVNGVDRALIEKMKAAGCGRIQFGVEQGTDAGLARLRKGVTIQEIEQAFRTCRELGVGTVAYFMIGTPTERTRLDVLRTIRYAIRLRPDFVMFNILTPFPGTRLFDEGVEEGVLELEPWTAFMRDPRADYRAQVWDQHFTREELRDLLALAYRSFYWRPRFVLGQLRQLRDPRDLMRKAKAGLRLLTDR